MASIKDIAMISGLSIGTVSNVIQGKDSVKPENKEKILKAMEQLNYRINYQARSLVSEKSMIIGLVFASPENPTESKMLLKFEDLAQKYGYQILWATTRLSGAREKASCEDMLSRRVDGLFVYSQSLENQEYFKHLAETESTPVILVGRYFNGVDLPHVAVDNRYAASVLVNHLASNGFKRVAYLDVAEEEEISPNRDRRKGIQKYCGEYGIDCDVLRFRRDGSDYSTGYRAFELLYSENRLPEIVIPRDDTFALGFYSACARYGVSVPDDLSILSYGKMYGDGITPRKLTTYDPEFDKVVEKSFEMFLKLDSLPIAERVAAYISEGKNNDVFIKGHLVEGETVKNLNA